MITITIAGADRTSFVPWPTLRIENILTQQVDRCVFTVKNEVGYAPSVGANVIITDGGTRVFGGMIVRRSQVSSVPGSVEYNVECSDYTRILDQHLVAETYQNMTVNEIIADIVTQFLPAGFTTSQVDCDTTVDYVQFKHEQVSSCLKQLADLVGYDWYVDYFMDIYFKSPNAETAPIEIEDDNGTYDNESLVIRLDDSQLRNSIVVKGGEYAGAEFTASVRADGKQITFNLPYKYENFAATLTGKPLDLGIDYIDNPDSYDALYNFQEKLLRFKQADRPNQNATLSFSGNPLLPVNVRYRDSALIAAQAASDGVGDGEYEFVIIDKSINSQVAARQRAAAEIRTYGETLSEGEFVTETAGLKAGMKIRVNSVDRNIDEYFIINRVTSKMPSPTVMIYEISLITTKTMDFIAIMKKLLRAENKNIVLDDGLLLDLTESRNESILFTVQTTVQALDYAVEWVLGPQVPTGTKRVFIVGGGRLS